MRPLGRSGGQSSEWGCWCRRSHSQTDWMDQGRRSRGDWGLVAGAGRVSRGRQWVRRLITDTHSQWSCTCTQWSSLMLPDCPHCHCPAWRFRQHVALFMTHHSPFHVIFWRGTDWVAFCWKNSYWTAFPVLSMVVSLVWPGDWVSSMTSAERHVSCSPVGSLMKVWLEFSTQQAVSIIGIIIIIIIAVVILVDVIVTISEQALKNSTVLVTTCALAPLDRRVSVVLIAAISLHDSLAIEWAGTRHDMVTGVFPAHLRVT